eukprot:CAMPEP_0113956770 /NCGR_PEP_ID=MMETSP0011_2-20120614/2276_1 /TAXON_ID=101924 /ORGANISM="Rhodosorus marinus" /LENGTH=353 /DNA_ID=CAMNT_0000967013 /DNA_START=325 /DNA_END=1386 /DNA_ORIENTATION=+ /assembly_acc=CAM_ASM_000156
MKSFEVFPPWVEAILDMERVRTWVFDSDMLIGIDALKCESQFLHQEVEMPGPSWGFEGAEGAVQGSNLAVRHADYCLCFQMEKHGGKWLFDRKIAIVYNGQNSLCTVDYKRRQKKVVFAIYTMLDVSAIEYTVTEDGTIHSPIVSRWERDCSFCAVRGDICECTESMRQFESSQLPRSSDPWKGIRDFYLHPSSSGWGSRSMGGYVIRIRMGFQLSTSSRAHNYMQEVCTDVLPMPRTSLLNEDIDNIVSDAQSSSEELCDPKSALVHVCRLCSAKFHSSYHLRRHFDGTHLNRRWFKCPQCSKSFKQKGHLSQHMRAVHTGGNHFNCKVCSKSFTWKSSYNRHMKDMHESTE